MNIEPQAYTVRFTGVVNPIITKISLSCIKIRKKYQTQGLWDTGAYSSAITKSMANQMDLKPIGKVTVHGVHGAKLVDWYFIHLEFYKGNIKIQLRVTECDSLGNSGADLLIGMDVIMLGDFAISNFSEKTTMTFRVPSIKEIDFVKEFESSAKDLSSSANPSRNEKCPCGSGSKYKNCCGKNK
jgi:hypothetical protein